MTRLGLSLVLAALCAAPVAAQVPPPDEPPVKQQDPPKKDDPQQQDPKKPDDPKTKPPVKPPVQPPAGPPVIAIGVKLAIPVAGADVQDAVILVQGTQIVAIGAKVNVPKSAKRVALTTAYATPGLVDAVTRVGATGDLWERDAAFTPEMRAADAFDPWHEQVAALAQAGVTTFGLVPRDSNVAGGFAAAANLRARADDDGVAAALLRDLCGPTFSLADAAMRSSRFPASRRGAVTALAQALTAGADPGAPMIDVQEIGRDVPFVRAALAAALKDDQAGALMHVSGPASIDAALGFAGRFADGLTLIFPSDAQRRARAIAAAKAGVILRPPTTADTDRALAVPARLHDAGVTVSFATDAPSGRPDRLMFGAALAHAAGLPRRAALAAVTQSPARALGVGDRVGTLAAGRQADIVFWSADPLSGTARVVAVMAAGEWVVKPGSGRPAGPSRPPTRPPSGVPRRR